MQRRKRIRPAKIWRAFFFQQKQRSPIATFEFFEPFVANFCEVWKKVSHKGHKEHKGKGQDELSKSISFCEPCRHCAWGNISRPRASYGGERGGTERRRSSALGERMPVLYKLAADLVVVVHFGYVSFVLVGQVLILLGVMCRWRWVRNPWFRWLHL